MLGEVCALVLMPEFGGVEEERGEFLVEVSSFVGTLGQFCDGFLPAGGFKVGGVADLKHAEQHQPYTLFTIMAELGSECFKACAGLVVVALFGVEACEVDLGVGCDGDGVGHGGFGAQVEGAGLGVLSHVAQSVGLMTKEEVAEHPVSLGLCVASTFCVALHGALPQSLVAECHTEQAAKEQHLGSGYFRRHLLQGLLQDGDGVIVAFVDHHLMASLFEAELGLSKG